MKRRARGEGSVFWDARVERWKAVAPWPLRLTRSGKTQSEAIRRRDQALAQFGLSGGRESVGEFFRAWLTTRALVVRPRTHERDSWLLDLAAPLFPLKLQKVGPEQIQSVLNASAKIHKPATTAILRRLLFRVFKTAQEWRKIAHNPVSGTVVPKVGRSKVRGLSDEARKALREAVRGTPDEALFDLYVVLGLRRGEALALKWPDVDLESGTLTVRAVLQRYEGELHSGEPKTAAGTRTIDLPPSLVRSLKRWRTMQKKMRMKAGARWFNDDDLVFTTRHGTPIEPRNVLRKLARLCPGATVHMLRHTAATRMIYSGISPNEVARILGHAGPEITLRVYAHVLRERSDVAKQKLTEIAAD